MNKSLTVYKASAGSGKTFTLAVEYISILVKDPENYRKILAVTFTNKATQEMKMRILSQLYGIANGLESSDSYLEKVKEKTGLEEIVIRNNAKAAMSLLIHKYNDFRVQTIDAFFQHVLRNLAHELDLSANLRVDLNDEQVENNAVDQMIEGLEPGQDVLKWIRDYIDKSIEDDLGWNVIGKIKDFGLNIFKDFYKDEKDRLQALFGDEDFFKEYTNMLRKKRNQLQKSMNDIAQKMLRLIRDACVDDSSYFTRWLYDYIVKRSTGRISNEDSPKYVLGCIEKAEKWVSKSCPAAEKDIVVSLASSHLCEMLKELEEARIGSWCEYQSCILTLAHLSQLRLLNAIANQVDELNKDSNRFMLSNTQSLLRKFIVDSDAPFVFEKIGARLKHIMIDEFQDTSTIQWENFRVLLDNCISQAESRNLIVGDIKQSIYRWREGDWKLLNDIDNPDARGFHDEVVDVQTLEHNFRSEENIVNFNNVFFEEVINTTVAELENDGIADSELLRKAYADVRQIPNRKDGHGYVRMELLPSSKDGYREAVLETLTNTVEMLLEKGYKQKDIAILVRSKGVIQDIADTFVRRLGSRVSIVSDEAFRLDASLAVNIIIDALHLLTHPDDLLTRGKLAKTYTQKVLKQNITDSDILVNLNKFDEEIKAKAEKQELIRLSQENQMRKLNQSLPDNFVKNGEKLLGMPIIDLVDELFTLFNLDTLKGQNTYVCTFYDTLNEYLRDHPADIDDFIKEWSSTLSAKTIQSDEIEGIRLITIHKSKGLEFDNVLIPFCDWTLEKGNIIWCKTEGKEAPFNEIPLVPVDFSKNAMQGTVYEDDYKQEHFQNTIDNMNLLYVAFTRAAKNLFVTGKRMTDKTFKEQQANPGTSNRSQGMELALEAIAARLTGSVLDKPASEKEPIIFEYGQLENGTDKAKENSQDNPFLVDSTNFQVEIKTFPHILGFRQSGKSREFVESDDLEMSDRDRYIKVGNILHQLFSTIYTTDDIPTKLAELEQEGIIYNDEVTTSELRRKIETAIDTPQVRDWFSPKWKIFNECAIIEYNEETETVESRRPDRVMTDGQETIVVDFKFGIPRDEYSEQVRGYMNMLTKMGYRNVKGYLWYVMRNQIDEVLPQS
ncbi:exodeoxyribonuclease V subunit beta [Prevotella sp. HUN102]|uniref:UvrD-helicase domain-containing protein n=1 Tax=Prevotella sp. HUN102 TaxID=1392486 RepID=UPI00048B3401|nr:UvrD-helicase domain-containing protein [Prevotella sp. HUN102]